MTNIWEKKSYIFIPCQQAILTLLLFYYSHLRFAWYGLLFVAFNKWYYLSGWSSSWPNSPTCPHSRHPKEERGFWEKWWNIWCGTWHSFPSMWLFYYDIWSNKAYPFPWYNRLMWKRKNWRRSLTWTLRGKIEAWKKWLMRPMSTVLFSPRINSSIVVSF